ncbi:MAG TPA: permease-like cell division protein FtsX [Rhodanobacteraceae bacterium]|nr:permease-like cell division protein FtsX [Rhodanobacteraceae bacterium]
MSAVAKSAPIARERRRSRFAIWREQHAWACASSLRTLGSRPLGTALTVLVMGFALALPLAFYLLLANVQRLSGNLGESQSISVFLQPSTRAAAAHALEEQLRGRADISEVAVKTPQQGLAELASVQGFGEALHALPDNPLPFVLLVQPRGDLTRAQTDALVAALRASSSVDVVQDNGVWRARLDSFIALGQRITVLLASLLALAALGVIGNTVRLDIRSRAEEIIVQRLVGASAGFVRRPFLYEGVWYGVLAGVIAVALVIALEWGLATPVHALAANYAGQLAFGGLAVSLLILIPLMAALLGWVGAFLASTRHLALSQPR